MINKIKIYISKSFFSVAYFLVFMNWVGGIGIHFYTTYFAYKISGLLSALLTFGAPVAAEIFWFFKSWINTGTFVNRYSYELLIYLAWLPLPLLFIYLGSKFSTDS